MEYLRLPSYRNLPASIALQCYRTAVWDETAKGVVINPQAVHANCMQSGLSFSALRCEGTDRRAAGRTGARFGKDGASYYDASFVGIQSAH